jgi:hypothetical protein
VACAGGDTLYGSGYQFSVRGDNSDFCSATNFTCELLPLLDYGGVFYISDGTISREVEQYGGSTSITFHQHGTCVSCPTPTPTSTPIPPTSTPTPTPTSTPTPTPTATTDPYFYFNAQRYECQLDGTCLYIEDLIIRNNVDLSIGGTPRYRLDPTTGYILRVMSTHTPTIALNTTMSGQGNISCSSFCTQPTPTPTSTPTPTPTPTPTSTPVPPTATPIPSVGFTLTASCPGNNGTTGRIVANTYYGGNENYTYIRIGSVPEGGSDLPAGSFYQWDNVSDGTYWVTLYDSAGHKTSKQVTVNCYVAPTSTPVPPTSTPVPPTPTSTDLPPTPTATDVPPTPTPSSTLPEVLTDVYVNNSFFGGTIGSVTIGGYSPDGIMFPIAIGDSGTGTVPLTGLQTVIVQVSNINPDGCLTVSTATNGPQTLTVSGGGTFTQTMDITGGVYISGNDGSCP